MTLFQGFRPTAVVGMIAATMALSACGGGGGDASSAASSNVLKLSSAIQSEHVARYAGAFGMLAGPGVAAIYTSVVASFVQGVTAGTASSSTACPGGGSVAVAAQSAGANGLQAGESATVTFNQCIGQVQGPTVTADSTADGTITVQVQSATGTVGSTTQNWSYTAMETANNVTLVSGNGTNTLSGTVTYTEAYDASTGITTTTANSPLVTIGRTQTNTSAGNVSGTISVASLAVTRQHTASPSSDVITSSASVSVSASDATIAFNVSTPTPVALTTTNGDTEVQSGVVQLSTDDTTETITALNTSSVGITVATGGQTATYNESIDAFKSIAGG